MISVTKLLFAREYFGDSLRYTKSAHSMKSGAAEGVGPVVVWNSPGYFAAITSTYGVC